MAARVVVVLLVVAAASLRGQAQEQMESLPTADTDGEARRAKPEPASDIADALARIRQDLTGTAGGAAGAALTALMPRNYKKMAQTILPLLVGFKATGLLVMAMAVTKFVLLKALFLSTTALLVAALLALKKFLTSGGQPHDAPVAYTFGHQDLSHVPYLHTAAADFGDSPHMGSHGAPQVTYIGGSYGLQSIPYAATGGAGGLAAGDDIQGLYSSHHNSVAALSQLQQLQQLQQQALLAQQLGNATGQQQQPQPQAGQLLQLSRRRLNAPQGATVSNQYRPIRPEARPA